MNVNRRGNLPFQLSYNLDRILDQTSNKLNKFYKLRW